MVKHRHNETSIGPEPPLAVHSFAQAALKNIAALLHRRESPKWAGSDVVVRTNVCFSHEVDGEWVTVHLEMVEDRAGAAELTLPIPQGGAKLVEALPEIAALLPYYCGSGRASNIEHSAIRLTFQVLPH